MTYRTFKQLINPHSHTHYSIDGASTVEDTVLRNKELGATHVAITEHGNMNSTLELYEQARKHGMKPICGIELYVQPPFLEELRPIIEQELILTGKLSEGHDKIEKIEKELLKEYVHLTVHFKDEWAYNYFTKLTPQMESRALVKYGERKPIATLDEIAGASGHITICSSCLIGMVNRFFLPRRKSGVSRPDLAEKAYRLLREIAGDGNFFVEIFPHVVSHEWKPPQKDKKNGNLIPGGFIPNPCTSFAPTGDLQKTSNEFMIGLANKYKDPIMVSLDSHFAYPSQKIVQDARLGNGKENWKFYNSYHICPTHEAFEVLQKQLNVDEKSFEAWIDNSYRFASLFDSYQMTTNRERWVLRPLGEDYQDKLISLINKFNRMNWEDPIMCERLRYEIEVLVNNGKINLLSYYFTVEDIASFCKENDILINVRGSAGGSLLLYLLGVSAVNPLKHNLSFERFLTLGRIKANTLPDVDIDVAEQHKVFEYLEQKYNEAFCRISTDINLKLKSSIRDAERGIIGKVRPETEKMCVTLPKIHQGMSEYAYTFGYEEDGVLIPGVIETFAPLKKYIAENPKIWETVSEMLGTIRQKSQHACGVVITDKPVQEYVPITQIGNAKVTGYSPKQLEAAGLIKFDILGLNTLKDIQYTLQLIKEHHGHVIDPFDLPYSKEVFDAIGEGDTVTVFQFDTETVKPYLRAIKPKSIDDLAALTALCRPGTLNAPSGEFDGNRELSLAEIYVARAQGRTIQYIHPDLEPITKETFGVQLYQEQTLQIFRDIAGYTYEQAEAVRRGIGKKDEVILASCVENLRKACTAKGWTIKQVELLIEQIMASSRYAFNKSHAISYAYIAYACTYLRLFYPLEWWTAILSNAKSEDLQYYWIYAKRWIKMPEINNSDEKFYIRSDNGQKFIQAPITLLDGVGPATTAEIALKKPFTDFDDFLNRINRRIINKRIVQKFIISGLLDSLFPAGTSDLEKLTAYMKAYQQNTDSKQHESLPDDLINLTPLQKLRYKRDIFTVYKIDWTDTAIPYLEKRGLVKKVSTVYEYNDPLRKNLNGIPLLTTEQFKRKIDPKNNLGGIYAVVGYVANTVEITHHKKQYNTKTHQQESLPHTRMKFLIEIGDLTVEVIKWPDWGSTHHGIEKDFNKRVVLCVINKKIHPEKGLQLTMRKIFDISNIDK